MPKNSKQLINEVEQLWDLAERENNRSLTASERERMQALLEQAKAQRDLEKRIQEMDPGAPVLARMGDGSVSSTGGPGDRFVASKEYQRVMAGDRGQTYMTGPIEVSSAPMDLKGTLLEPGVGGPGGGLVPPQYQPGIVERLFEPLGVRDVFGTSPTTASQVRYVLEGTATNAAAGVAEGGTKPESTIAMSEVTEPIKKIATVLPISDELLEDAASVQTYLNGRLTLFVSMEEERQLLRGAGTNELVGIFGRSGINTYTKLAADDNSVALAKVIANTAGSSYLVPDTVILHPTNWLNTRLLRDGTGGTIGQYFGGGPFSGAYGAGGAPGMFGQSIWNTRVVLSTYVGAGTALVGNFGQAAHIWRRGGVSVEATNSHSDYFIKNLSMLRAEERLGLGVYRPIAFTEVRGLT